MTAGELKRLLQDVPDSIPVAVEYDRGACFDDQVDARTEDGYLVIATGAHHRQQARLAGESPVEVPKNLRQRLGGSP